MKLEYERRAAACLLRGGTGEYDEERIQAVVNGIRSWLQLQAPNWVSKEMELLRAIMFAQHACDQMDIPLDLVTPAIGKLLMSEKQKRAAAHRSNGRATVREVF